MCLAHGGRTPRGAASPHFRSGRHSRALPARLAARFAEAEADPERLALREEVALVDARIGDLLERAGQDGLSRAAKDRIWAGVMRLVALRRRLVEAELRRQAAARETLSVEEATALFAALTELVLRNVEDKGALRRIVEGAERLLEQRRAARGWGGRA